MYPEFVVWEGLSFLLLFLFLFLIVAFRQFPKHTFRIFSWFGTPIVKAYLRRRVKRGVEDGSRVCERFGIPSVRRPMGKLLWIHAVSVGEMLSIIPIVRLLKNKLPELTILLTTTTLTSAKEAKCRLGNSVIHQFMPFDIFSWDRRFVEYWQPSCAIFVESDLWPNMLYLLRDKKIPAHLLNARFSKRSLKRMCLLKKSLGILPFSTFEKVYAPSIETAENTKKLGARAVCVLPNLKIIAEKLPVNHVNLEHLKKQIIGRKTWMAVSTHPGEEEIILDAHEKLRRLFPNILTILAIRHPARLVDVQGLCEKRGLTQVASSTATDAQSTISADVYILDKIGWLGEFFSAVDTVLVGGSLVPGIGGHNFLEPLNFGCNVAVGEYIDNFRDVYPHFATYCKVVRTPNEICEFVAASPHRLEIDAISSVRNTALTQWNNAVDEMVRSFGG